jgi:hypothetical protein
VVSDPDGTLAGIIGSTAIPTSVLIDADHNVIAVQIGNYTSVQAALFEILARDPGSYTGHFRPSDYAEPDHFVEIAPFEAAEVLPCSFGETAAGPITGEDFQQVYTFAGQAGDVVSARVDAEPAPSGGYTLEPYVVLLTPEGEYLAESRDFLYEPYAEVQPVTLPEDGAYFVVATRYMGADGISAGEYRLTVTDRGTKPHEDSGD